MSKFEDVKIALGAPETLIGGAQAPIGVPAWIEMKARRICQLLEQPKGTKGYHDVKEFYKEKPQCYYCKQEADGPMLVMGDQMAHAGCAQRKLTELLDPDFEPAPVEQPKAERPTIVCLCGSGRFREAFGEAECTETLAGRIVLTIGCNTKDVARTPELAAYKPMLDELHLRKIDLADEVLILNVGGYIGESTQRELTYAQAHGKTIRFLEQPKAEPRCSDVPQGECPTDCAGDMQQCSAVRIMNEDGTSGVATGANKPQPDEGRLLNIGEWLEAIGCDKAYKKDMLDTYSQVLPELKAQLAKDQEHEQAALKQVFEEIDSVAVKGRYKYLRANPEEEIIVLDEPKWQVLKQKYLKAEPIRRTPTPEPPIPAADQKLLDEDRG